MLDDYLMMFALACSRFFHTPNIKASAITASALIFTTIHNNVLNYPAAASMDITILNLKVPSP
jgi:hypothetical protein